MESHADLEDAVIHPAYRSGCRAPEQLDGLVLLEELASVELVDPLDELAGRGIVATRALGFLRRSGWRTLRRDGGVPRGRISDRRALRAGEAPRWGPRGNLAGVGATTVGA